MIEGIQSFTGPKSEPDQTEESMALAGAAAIRRIIADRDSLRSWASSQQRELTSLRAANENLQRRVLLIRQHYLELSTQILGHFEQFDGALREALQDPCVASSPSDDDMLVELAQRLSPANRASMSELVLSH
jgi:hypothetical protein